MREDSEEREKTVKVSGSGNQGPKRKAIRARSRCWNPKLPLCFNIKSIKKKNMQVYLERDRIEKGEGSALPRAQPQLKLTIVPGLFEESVSDK